jgi:hypothetical protein
MSMILKKISAKVASALLISMCAQGAVAQVQLAPSGYSGIINVPHADVMSFGTMVGSWSNSNPESTRLYKGYGPFGGYNLGFGVLPNVEAVARLTYDGDLNCDTYYGGCKSSTRDISVNGKVRLPLPPLPLNTRFAVGMSDYGGAATLYRQAYGVGTSTLGPLDVSVGFSKAQPSDHGGGLIQGKFAGVALHVTDYIKLLAENDSRESRVGASVGWRPLPDWGVAVAASRKLSHNTPQQAQQLMVTMSYHMDGYAIRKGQPSAGPSPARVVQSQPEPKRLVDGLAQSKVETMAVPTAAPAAERTADIDEESKVKGIADAMVAAGFSEVSVGRDGMLWHVRAEPRVWRKNRLDALAAALGVWLRVQGESTHDVLYTLTYLQNPVLQARTNSACLYHYAKGVGLCDKLKPIQLKSEPIAMAKSLEAVQWSVRGDGTQFLRPDFEIGPSATYAVGTEFGLTDYSLGLSKGWELPLYKGLVWHGFHTQFVTQSDDFRDPQSYFRRVGLGEKTAWGANMLSYTRPLYTGLWAEATTGYLASGVKGSNVTMVWDSPDNRWKVTGFNGVYHRDNAPQSDPLQPSYVTLRYAVLPGKWALSATKGRFLNNDSGIHLMTTHFFGDHRLRFYYRKTGPGNETTPNQRAFAGFSWTLPIGPKESYAIGPVTVRGRDQWALGLETKVQEKDNYIEPGYGLFPSIRHGLQADVTDYDRGDVGYLEANMHRFWAGLRDRMAMK